MKRLLLTSVFVSFAYLLGFCQPHSPVLTEPPNGASVNSTPETGWQDGGNSFNGELQGDVPTTYRIQVADNRNFSSNHIVLDATVPITWLRIPAGVLALLTDYYWRVNVTNSQGTSSFSEPWEFTTDAFGGFGSPVGTKEESPILTGEEIDRYVLNQNYPNPFNPTTNIIYSVPQGNFVKIMVYDISGKVVSTLIDAFQNKGTYSVSWDGGNFASGLYFYRLESGSYSEIRKMFLIK